MAGIIYFFRDVLSGWLYFVYALVIIFFIFATIGYMLTDKYQNNSKN